MSIRRLVLIILFATTVAVQAAPGSNSVLRVNVTSQPYDFFRPWSKRAPYSREGLGAVLSGGRILVTAELVANANYIELEQAANGRKMAATVDVVDYEANLALLKPAESSFLEKLSPLEITSAKVGDRPAFWQLENTGTLLETSALITTVEISRYPLDDTSLLVYRATSTLQYRQGSFTLPVIKEGRLTGMLMRFDARTQNADIIPAPVIEHFLKDAATAPYKGFPRAGLQFSVSRDPQLRRFAGLDPSVLGGVYISKVPKNSPAEAAGVRTGDILVKAAGYDIDQDGNYQDPTFGTISLVHLFSTLHYDKDLVELQLLRAGKPLTLKLAVAHEPAAVNIIEPYTIDKAPSYYVLGGLVLQELSRQYLKEWPDLKKAPPRLVYYDRYQSELFSEDPRKRIIILSQVLPSQVTLGYEELGQLVVTKINNIEIRDLTDVEKAAAQPLNGFHKVEFQEFPSVIYLDAEQLRSQEPLLMRAYGLPAIKGGPAFH